MEWKVIPGYEDYMVSNDGQVMSLKNGERKLLKPYLNGEYLRIELRNDKRKAIYIHQLVAIAFLQHNIDGHKLVIDHINSNKLDNRVENLRIVTHRENKSKSNEYKNKSSKYTGVYFSKNRWQSYITINSEYKYLGRFNTEYEAYLAYQQALNHSNSNQQVPTN